MAAVHLGKREWASAAGPLIVGVCTASQVFVVMAIPHPAMTRWTTITAALRIGEGLLSGAPPPDRHQRLWPPGVVLERAAVYVRMRLEHLLEQPCVRIQQVG